MLLPLKCYAFNTEPAKHHTFIYYVHYRYLPATTLTKLPSPYTGTEQVDENTYTKLATGIIIPILYMPDRHDLSAINIDDRIHIRNPYANMYRVLQLFFLMFAVFYGLMLLIIIVFYYQYRLEKKLLAWGQPVEAVIINEKIKSIRGGKYAEVTYQFHDAKGNNIRGKCRYVSLKTLQDGTLKADIPTLPIVLYDPNNTRRHILYPPLYATLTT